MMKKYNKPEIVALALETVDVIATSVTSATVSGMLQDAGVTATVQSVSSDIDNLKTNWSW